MVGESINCQLLEHELKLLTTNHRMNFDTLLFKRLSASNNLFSLLILNKSGTEAGVLASQKSLSFYLM